MFLSRKSYKIKSFLQYFKRCRGRQITLLSSIYLGFSLFYGHFRHSSILLFLGLFQYVFSFKRSMNQNLDLCPKPSIYAVSQRSKILLSRPNCLNFPDLENSAVFRQMPSDICRSPMPAKLFKSFIHQAFQLLWRSFITECFPSRPAFPSLPLHHPASDAYRC